MGRARLSAPCSAQGSVPVATLPPHAFGRKADAPPEQVVTLRQVHGTDVVRVAGNPPAPACGEGDALLTDQPGAVIGVRTADCLPILLAARDGAVVGAVHAGWRGAVAGIAAQAVAAFFTQYGVRPDEITALLGPCIRPCCFEVGPEVIEEVTRCHPRLAGEVTIPQNPRPHLDLAGLNRLLLNASGVTRVTDCGECTCCQPEIYHSYRRDANDAGRMVSWIQAVG